MKAQKVPIITVLNAVIATGVLGKSARHQDLLKYLLTEEYEGRGAQISAYNVAVDALGRDDNFDSNTDSLVRVAMHKLRKKLTEFNASSSDFTLEIPKASYRITLTSLIEPEQTTNTGIFSFIKRTDGSINPWAILGLLTVLIGLSLLIWRVFSPQFGTSQTTQIICSTTRPNLALEPTRVVGDNGLNGLGQDTAAIADNYLHTGLAQYSMVNLVPNTIDCRESGTPFYTLQTQIFATADHPYISIHTRHATSQNLVLTERIQIPENSQSMGKDTSWAFYKTASKLANANGAILNDANMRAWADTQTQQDYQCLTFALMKYVHFTSETYQSAVECTQSAVERETQNPEFYALLATFYISQARGRQPVSTLNPMATAEKLIEEATLLQPRNPEVLAVRLHIHAVSPSEHTEEIKHLIQALEQESPYNPHMLLLISQVSGAKLGNWEQAKTYAETTYKLDDSKANDLYYMEFVYAFLFEDPEESYEKALKIHYPQSPVASIANLAAAHKANKPLHAQACKEALALLGLNTVSDYKAIIQKSNYHPQFEDELIKWVSFVPQ